MYKEIGILMADGTEQRVPFKANAATPIRLKQVFGIDFWKTFDDGDAAGNVEAVMKLAYVMHCQGAGKDLTAANEDTYVEWLEGISGTGIIDKGDEIFGLYMGSGQQGAKPKKGAAQPRGR